MELADTSAWANRHRDDAVLEDFNRRLEDGRIATCRIVQLELLWSSVDHRHFVERRQRLEALDEIPIGPAVWDRVVEVFELLAARGPLHHRQVKLPDLIVAAAAESADVVVCHYDRDFETIAEVTGQPVRAIAPLGSL